MMTQETGILSVVHVGPTAGEMVDVLGEVLTFKLGSATTGGALSLAAVASQPGGGPPALHTHPPLEALYVLEGEYEISGLGAEGPFAVRATPGSVIYVPPGVPHNYKNVGATPGRMLAIFTSPTMEAFQKELAAAGAGLAPAGPPDLAKLMPVLEKYEVAFVGPPPG